MEKQEVIDWALDRYQGTVLLSSWGESSIFYNPELRLPRGVYFLTIKDKDGPNDCASSLNREGAFRVNFGVGEDSYSELFGSKPPRPPKGGVVSVDHDFTKINVLGPHPVYAWMGYLSIIRPTVDSLTAITPLIDESYERAVLKFDSRTRK